MLAGERSGWPSSTIDNPHPEVSWRRSSARSGTRATTSPSYVWQSTGGTDDFEPKLALTPLLVGTLKGTFYSLLLAIPLGVLGAMYASQFMHPAYKRVVKPTVEIMAALPSVVLGFLAGLWLAPRIERAFPALRPDAGRAAARCARRRLACGTGCRARFRGRFPAGTEVVPLRRRAGARHLALPRSSRPRFERLAFGGNFQAWLLRGDRPAPTTSATPSWSAWRWASP